MLTLHADISMLLRSHIHTAAIDAAELIIYMMTFCRCHATSTLFAIRFTLLLADIDAAHDAAPASSAIIV